MPPIARIMALLEVLRPVDVESLKPAERRRFADLCGHWRQVAERQQGADHRQAGVLSDLRRGHRAE